MLMQLIEHTPSKQVVVGSIPAGRTTFKFPAKPLCRQIAQKTQNIFVLRLLRLFAVETFPPKIFILAPALASLARDHRDEAIS